MKQSFGIGLLFLALVAMVDIAAGQEPVPIKRVNPEYPATLFNDKVEGWVMLNFILSAEGKVSDAIAVKSSNPGFEAPAIEALSQWQYEPQPDGVKSSQAIFRYQSEQNAGGPGEGFILASTAIDAQLNEKRPDGIREQLDTLYQQHARTMAEVTLFYWLEFRYYMLTGDSMHAYAAISTILPVNSAFMPASLVVVGAETAFLLAASGGKYREALGWHEFLKNLRLSGDLPIHQQALQRMEAKLPEVERAMAADAQIVVPGQVSYSYWEHLLVHSDFAITNISGTLSKIDLRCGNTGPQQLDVVADVKMELPDTWKDCRLYVSGEKGSTFTLVELQPAASEPGNTP